MYISSSKKIRDDDIISELKNIGNIVITGTGGAGKTMLMKYLCLQCISEPCGKIPLYVELRSLPTHIPANFYKTIFEYCCPNSVDSDYNMFRELLLKGAFIIFFDGLDEISSERRDQIFNSIRRMTKDFCLCSIIASTRPEIDTRNWGELDTYAVNGLTLNQAKNLVKKVDYPSKLKDEFLELLDDSFYKKHSSFLSIPLLCSLMLLTYHEFQSIPSRITVFYEQSFETLMRRHDREKEGHFKRSFESELSSDRFKVVFSAFCYRTLALQHISFTDDAFRHHLSRAADASEISVDIDKYASDLVSSVCVIMRDGLNLHFIHRSFQEYFAAIFLLRHKSGEIYPLYRRLFETLNINDVAPMAADIDIQAFERDWALPACRKIRDALESISSDDRPLELLRLTWHTLRISNEGRSLTAYSWIGGNEYHETLVQLAKVYGAEHPNLESQFRGESEDENSIIDIMKRIVGTEGISNAFSGDEGDGGEPFEILTEGDHIQCIRFTSLYQDIQSCIDEIYALHSELETRVRNREKIDILQ